MNVARQRSEMGSAQVHARRGVLVLDESPSVRRRLIKILERLGTEASDIFEAASAEEALPMFREVRPAVVICELVGVRPDEGLDAVHEMLERDPDIPVVLLTSEPRDSPEVRAALRAGAFAHLPKPPRLATIREVLIDVEEERLGLERI